MTTRWTKPQFLELEPQNKWRRDPNHPLNKLIKKYEKGWIKK